MEKFSKAILILLAFHVLMVSTLMAKPLTTQLDVGILSITGFNAQECSSEIELFAVLVNAGSTTITFASIECAYNNEASWFTEWNGILNPSEETSINLGAYQVQSGINVIQVNVLNPNYGEDLNPMNDMLVVEFLGLPNEGTELTVNITTDMWPEETSWEIWSDTTLVYASGSYAAMDENNSFSYSMCLLPGCYTFVINDEYGDGICCTFGDGSYEVLDEYGNQLAFGGEFQWQATEDLCISTSTFERSQGNLKVFPNPTTGPVSIDYHGQIASELNVFDLMGSLVQTKRIIPGMNNLNLSELSDGYYLFSIKNERFMTMGKVQKFNE